MREEYNKTAKKQIKENDPLPPAIASQFTQKYGDTVNDGISSLQKAIGINPDYDDAMAYLNLLFRQKADMETSADARNADLQQADELVDKVKAIKQKKANVQPTFVVLAQPHCAGGRFARRTFSPLRNSPLDNQRNVRCAKSPG